MGRVQNSNCGVMPADFFEKLASCARIDPDTGYFFINTICFYVDCEDADPAIQCADPNLLDAEQFCADNLFGVDDCGNLGLRLGVCSKIFNEI